MNDTEPSNPLDMPKKWTVVGDESIAPLDEDNGIIVSGLGATNNMPRYIAVIPTADSSQSTLSSEDITTIFEKKFPNTIALLEKITIENTHILLELCVSLDTALDDVIMPLIRALNAEKTQVKEHYLATNTERPSRAIIEEYLQEVANLSLEK